MVTLADVMTAAADQIDTVLSMETDIKIHVEGRAFIAAEVPAVDMFPTGSHGLEGGLAGFADEYGGIPLAIRARVSTADLYSGEEILLAMMDDEDPLSIVAALDSDRTLGGVLSTLSWGDGWPWSGYTDFPSLNGDGTLLGSILNIVVVKAHS